MYAGSSPGARARPIRSPIASGGLYGIFLREWPQRLPRRGLYLRPCKAKGTMAYTGYRETATCEIARAEKTWCFFDLDGTLLRRSGFWAYILGWVLKNLLRGLGVAFLPFHYLRCRLRRRDGGALQEALLRAFMAGARRAAVDAYTGRFWEAFLPLYQNDDIVSRLRWHHENEHSIYLLTSTPDFIAEPLMRLWPLNGVIATRTVWRGDVFTGFVEGRFCRGLEKIERMREELGIELTAERYYFYTADDCDLPLLVYTDNGFLVRDQSLCAWEHRAED